MRTFHTGGVAGKDIAGGPIVDSNGTATRQPAAAPARSQKYSRRMCAAWLTTSEANSTPTAKNTPVMDTDNTNSSTSCHSACRKEPVQMRLTSVARRATTA